MRFCSICGENSAEIMIKNLCFEHTADSGWVRVKNHLSRRICCNSWLIALQRKMQMLPRGNENVILGKGVLWHVKLWDVSRSSHSYLPGKPLSSDLRCTVIDKILERGGRLLIIIFPANLGIRLTSDNAAFPTQKVSTAAWKCMRFYFATLTMWPMRLLNATWSNLLY